MSVVGDAGTPEPASDEIGEITRPWPVTVAPFCRDDLLAIKHELRWCLSDGGFFTTLPAAVMAWINDTSGDYLAWENAANARLRAVGKDPGQP